MRRKMGLAVPTAAASAARPTPSLRSTALGRAGMDYVIRFGKWFLYGWVSGASAL